MTKREDSVGIDSRYAPTISGPLLGLRGLPGCSVSPNSCTLFRSTLYGFARPCFSSLPSVIHLRMVASGTSPNLAASLMPSRITRLD